jgi:hypothetical protein
MVGFLWATGRNTRRSRSPGTVAELKSDVKNKITGIFCAVLTLPPYRGEVTRKLDVDLYLS